MRCGDDRRPVDTIAAWTPGPTARLPGFVVEAVTRSSSCPDRVHGVRLEEVGVQLLSQPALPEVPGAVVEQRMARVLPVHHFHVVFTGGGTCGCTRTSITS